MKTVLIAGILMTGLFKCGSAGMVAGGCEEIATVTDFTGLDGCGLMFVLKDSTRLNPERRQYFVAPEKEDDPLYYFELKAGQKVKIAYNKTNTANVCMAGQTVFITCITKIE
ncbi:MAG TPA: hypothetical protein VFE50_08635 [Cyclobacteriaceae bacterium]|nr:hypothetical protein [Cyclobacteriaceae bacterium]